MPTIDEVLNAELTPDQKQAAIDQSKEVMTLACAGSGKSKTLAYRIGWQVANGADPKTIVAFTFTEKAADSMKRQTAKALTACGLQPLSLGAMYIGTIHSYCHYVLSTIDARYKQFEVLDENKFKLYLMSRYAQLGLSDVRNARRVGYFKTIKEASDAWKTLNDEMIPIAAVQQHDPLMGRVLERLGQRLDNDNFIDFSLMIRLVVESLRRSDTRAEQAIVDLKHLLVDEYQDVNPAQEVLISELHRRSDSLFVVGDDDQAIYGWRGADVGNILTFQNRYPSAGVHTLACNFRSTPLIVQVADTFIAAQLGAQRITKHPQALAANGPNEVRNLWFADRSDEAAWVASRIGDLLGTSYQERDGTVRGLVPADFAILMRSTRQNEGNEPFPHHAPFTEAMGVQGIRFTLESGGGVFENEHVVALRDSFLLLRHGSPSREQVRDFYDNTLLPLFPQADFEALARVFGEWGRLIHAPIQGSRRRVYPQKLVHDILASLGIGAFRADDPVWYAIGVFSRIIQDVEAVYMSIDTTARFQEILNFLENVAETGYDLSTDELLTRPNAVMVSTVHKVKGLEFPVVFIVDVEHLRFPGARRGYSGWLPDVVIQPALARGAYQSTTEEQARLFYTALTRSEKYLYVTGSEQLPGGRKPRKRSSFSLQLNNPAVSSNPVGLPAGLTQSPPARREEETVVPSTYSDIRYYLRCPADYQFRKRFGFSPPITEMFGFGLTVHAAVGRLHQDFQNTTPTDDDAERIAESTFHLKHVPPSNDPVNSPGPYERAKNRVSEVIKQYVKDYSSDFQAERQVEVRFEIPLEKAVITGTIDLILEMDEQGNILDATVIDFKTLEGGDNPEADLDWTELALQVQLYAKAAREVLGENARTGAVHLLKDNKRVGVPVTDEALAAATANVEWAIERILDGDFPRRPHIDKCKKCDFQLLCLCQPEQFKVQSAPPPIHIPGAQATKLARAFSEYQP